LAEYSRIRQQAQQSDYHIRKGFVMNLFIPLLALALLAKGAIPAESRSVTFYSDGAVVELESDCVQRLD
jgi:hypothetical protein